MLHRYYHDFFVFSNYKAKKFRLKFEIDFLEKKIKFLIFIRLWENFKYFVNPHFQLRLNKRL